MLEADNEIIVLCVGDVASVAFIQNGMQLCKFKYDELNKNMRSLKEIAKTLNKYYSFKYAKIKVKNENKLVKRIIRIIKKCGIVVVSVEK